jgi:hypothetical protein
LAGRKRLSCLRYAEQIATLQERGYGLRLNRSGSLVAFARKSAQEDLGEAEIGKLRHVMSFK